MTDSCTTVCQIRAESMWLSLALDGSGYNKFSRVTSSAHFMRFCRSTMQDAEFVVPMAEVHTIALGPVEIGPCSSNGGSPVRPRC